MSNFRKLSLVVVALFLNVVIACSGVQKDQMTNNSPGLKVTQVGRSFQLVEVNYANGHLPYRAQPNDFILSIVADNHIKGSIFNCNTFDAGAIWAADKHLYISGYNPGTAVCTPTQTAPPIALTQVMNFVFISDTQLNLSDAAGTFTASFVQY